MNECEAELLIHSYSRITLETIRNGPPIMNWEKGSVSALN